MRLDPETSEANEREACWTGNIGLFSPVRSTCLPCWVRSGCHQSCASPQARLLTFPSVAWIAILMTWETIGQTLPETLNCYVGEDQTTPLIRPSSTCLLCQRLVNREIFRATPAEDLGC